MNKKLPFQRIVLKNGLTVLLYPLNTASSFLELDITTGSEKETARTYGLAHFVEHFIFQGSKNFPKPRSLSQELEKEGIFHNGGTGRLDTSYWFKGPKQKLDQMVKLMDELVFNPLLPESRLEHVRQVITSEYQDFWQNQENRFYHDTLARRFSNRNHPYVRRALGTLDNINRFNQKESSDWHRRFYQPTNIVLAISGKFETTKLIKLLETSFGNRPSTPKEKTNKPSVNYSPLSFYQQISEAKGPQIRFEITFPCGGSKPNSRRQNLARKVFETILGSGVNSRLFKRLREKENLVYNVSAASSIYPWAGILSIDGSTDQKNLIRSLSYIKEEMEKIKKSGFKKHELQQAKNIITSRLSFSFETPAQIANWLVGEEVWEKEIFLPQDYIEILNQITKQEVEKFTSLLDYKKLNLNLLGNLSKKEFQKAKEIFS